MDILSFVLKLARSLAVKMMWVLVRTVFGLLPKTYLTMFLSFLGTQSSFRRLYEEPIVRGQQPDATGEEKLLGQTRAAEVNSNRYQL